MQICALLNTICRPFEKIVAYIRRVRRRSLRNTPHLRKCRLFQRSRCAVSFAISLLLCRTASLDLYTMTRYIKDPPQREKLKSLLGRSSPRAHARQAGQLRAAFRLRAKPIFMYSAALLTKSIRHNRVKRGRVIGRSGVLLAIVRGNRIRFPIERSNFARNCAFVRDAAAADCIVT